MTDYELLSTLTRKEEELNKLKSKIESKKGNIPEGILKFETRSTGKTYYYFVPSGTCKKRYLRKSELNKISSLAQRDYEKKGIQLINALLSNIEDCIQSISSNSLEAFYDKIPQERKALITPLVYDKDSFLKKWESVTYEPKSFSDEAPVHMTDKGERVRSKSEIMIANALHRYGIPYRYEFPLTVNGFEIRPDFTVLNPNTNQEFIWEHFGMMDDISYCEEAIRKLSTYQDNNILPGKKLITTYESRRFPLTKRIIDQTIREYLLN